MDERWKTALDDDKLASLKEFIVLGGNALLWRVFDYVYGNNFLHTRDSIKKGTTRLQMKKVESQIKVVYTVCALSKIV